MTTRKVPLHEIAHARAGDKGNTSNISVGVLEPGDCARVLVQLPAVRRWGGGADVGRGAVARSELALRSGRCVGMGGAGAGSTGFPGASLFATGCSAVGAGLTAAGVSGPTGEPRVKRMTAATMARRMFALRLSRRAEDVLCVSPWR